MSSQVTLSQTSGHGPALTTFNNALVLAWAGLHNDYLNVASSTDGGQTWGSPTIISSQQTAANPAIAALGGLFYFAWAGTDSSRFLNLMQSSDLKSFSGQVAFQEALLNNTGPALVAFKEALYVAWTSSNGQLMMSKIVDGALTNGVAVGQASASSPALAADDSYMYLAWTGTNYKPSIEGTPGTQNIPATYPNLNVIRSSGGASFSNHQTLSETTYETGEYGEHGKIINTDACQPALTVSGGKLILGWTGDDKNNSLNTMYSTDQGLTFGGKQTDTGNSSHWGPALYSSYIAFTGTDNRLNIKQGV
jgi:hypothetical protein